MSHRDRFEIRIAGLGGQGVVTIGRVLGIAFSVYEGLNSVNTQSYGPESRGGACRSEVVVSSEAINYPYVRRADLFVCLTQTALEAYVTDLAPNGVLLADRDGVMDLPRDLDAEVIRAPFMETADRLGGIKFQNAVALGAIQHLLADRLTVESVRRAMADCLPAEFMPINLAAFDQGGRLVAGERG